ncbi:hypothetical protein Ocin01_15220 [Orchesella cincta]|uniref:Uncharacterized protein n=1 Tax=Orchesella cincta TaxID=48709 RepID=A0A1D2MEZ2_ORCCI|nr:hypothetical protein Ocin01_15220 [Orchesella cincta]
MFFVIACNLFPDSKILQPSDCESEGEEECDTENAPPTPDFLVEKSPASPPRKRMRPYRRSCARRLAYGRADDVDHSWRTQARRRSYQRQRNVTKSSKQIIDSQNLLDAINRVVENYSRPSFQSEQEVCTSDIVNESELDS